LLEPEQQLKVITRHAVDVVTEEDLLAEAASGPFGQV